LATDPAPSGVQRPPSATWRHPFGLSVKRSSHVVDTLAVLPGLGAFRPRLANEPPLRPVGIPLVIRQPPTAG